MDGLDRALAFAKSIGGTVVDDAATSALLRLRRPPARPPCTGTRTWIPGTVTGKNQGPSTPWAGNADYVVRQRVRRAMNLDRQGLVRFAVPASRRTRSTARGRHATPTMDT